MHRTFTDTAKPVLAAGQRMPLPAEGEALLFPASLESRLPPNRLRIDKVDGTKISVTFFYTDAAGDEQHIDVVDHDLQNDNPLILGRGPGKTRNNVVNLPDAPSLTDLSRDNSTIYLEAGKIYYGHEGRHRVRKPDFAYPADEITRPLPNEGGSGRGYTHENRKLQNNRLTNEDRGLALQGPIHNANDALQFLYDAITGPVRQAVAATTEGGAALGMVLRSSDGWFECAHVGDPLIYAIAQNRHTEDIHLIQFGVPHTKKTGDKIMEALGKLSNPPDASRLDTLLEAIATAEPALVERAKTKAWDSAVTKNLSRQRIEAEDMYNDQPSVFGINPAAEFPPEGDYIFRGVLLGSDALDAGVKNGEVQKALRPLYADNATPKPETVAETAVLAAVAHTSDNTSALVLPADALPGDLITLADGNDDSVQAAEAVLAGVRAACRAPAHGAVDATGVAGQGISPGGKPLA